MRVKAKVNVTVTEDSAGKNKLFALDDAGAEVTLDGFMEVSSGQAKVAAQASFTVPFGGITAARGVMLKGSQDFSVAINGGAPLSVLRGITGSGNAKADSARLFLEAALDSVVVTAGDEDLLLIYSVWGDPTA